MGLSESMAQGMLESCSQCAQIQNAKVRLSTQLELSPPCSCQQCRASELRTLWWPDRRLCQPCFQRAATRLQHAPACLPGDVSNPWGTQNNEMVLSENGYELAGTHEPKPIQNEERSSNRRPRTGGQNNEQANQADRTTGRKHIPLAQPCPTYVVGVSSNTQMIIATLS